jgi:hypothetical protein
MERVMLAGVFKGGIAKRKDVSPGEGTGQYGNVAFADPVNNKYPIDTEEHIRAAWNYIHKPQDAAKYSADDVSAIKSRIVSAWKKTIDKAGPPSAAAKGETMNLAQVFKPTGAPVRKSQQAAKAMVLRKVVAKSDAQKKVEDTRSLAGDLGVASVFRRNGGGSGC